MVAAGVDVRLDPGDVSCGIRTARDRFRNLVLRHDAHEIGELGGVRQFLVDLAAQRSGGPPAVRGLPRLALRLGLAQGHLPEVRAMPAGGLVGIDEFALGAGADETVADPGSAPGHP